MRHSVGIVGIEGMWLLPANLLTVGRNAKSCRSRKEFQHPLDGRKPCKKGWSEMPHCRRKKSASCSNANRNAMKMRMNTFRPTMYPIKWLPPNVLGNRREWILCFQSHMRGMDVTRRKSGAFVHFSNRPRFPFRSLNLRR